MRSLGVGFSFAGIHCDDMRCELGNNDSTMHYFTDNFSVVTENVDGYDGAYYAGESVKEKPFEIDLFIENQGDDTIARIAHWMRKGAYGKLIFDHMPYKYYNVRVTSPIDLNKLYTKFDFSRNMFTYSGIISVTLTAYTPYAYLLDEVRDNYPDVGDMLNTLNANSYMMENTKRPPVSGAGNNINIIAANLGNAIAKPEIWITGTFPTGTTIRNETTGQEMTIKTTQRATYCISSITGTTTKWESTVEHPTSEAEHESVYENYSREMADTVKTGNFITLVPSFPEYAKTIYTVMGKNMVSMPNAKTYKGKYVYLEGKWRRIEYASPISPDMYEIILDESISQVRGGEVDIVNMNKITIVAGEGDTVERATIYFQDTFQ